MKWNSDNYKIIDGQYTQIKKIKFGQCDTMMDHQSYGKFFKGEKDGKWSWYRPDGILEKEGTIKTAFTWPLGILGRS